MMNLVEKFERYLIGDGKSPKTIESYINDNYSDDILLQDRANKYFGL